VASAIVVRSDTEPEKPPFPMPTLAAALLAASSKSSTTTTSGSSAFSLLILFVFVLGAYFLFIRPRSQATRRQREDLQEIVTGDEVLTGAGIFGTVLDVAADRVTLETAPGTRMTVLRSTIARRITPQTVDEESWEDHDGEWDEHDGHGDAEHDGHDGDGHGHGGHGDDGHDEHEGPDDEGHQHEDLPGTGEEGGG
jgi:preprotein translocase subunit YajC